MHILFYDAATPLAYNAATPQQQALGGTEATVIRVAHGLKDYHTVYIAQHCRNTTDNHIDDSVHYISLSSAKELSPDVVVLLRQYRLADDIGKQFPHARHFLWLHNMPARELYSMKNTLLQHRYEMIAVSEFHKLAIKKRLRGKWFQSMLQAAPELPIHVLYNPIDNHLHPDYTPWKANQLLFLSSPQKGLEQTLKMFQTVREYFPEYHLLIANPGYQAMNATLPPQTKFLGALPRHELLQHLRESFCVFYPQTERVETFGLVYAEANAVGTPVLAHDSGAAREVLSDAEQVVDGRKVKAVIAKLVAWRKKRPVLQGQERFRLKQIVQDWLVLL